MMMHKCRAEGGTGRGTERVDREVTGRYRGTFINLHANGVSLAVVVMRGIRPVGRRMIYRDLAFFHERTPPLLFGIQIHLC